jgi:hypothetical protein
MPDASAPLRKAFISSSVRDLREHRDAAALACENLGLIAVRLDELTADTKSAIEVLEKALGGVDVYIGIIGTRYGGIPAGYAISFTEIEYDLAFRRQIPCLIFMMGDAHPVMQEYVDGGAAREKLAAFKRKLLARHTVAYFNSPEELYERVYVALSGLLNSLSVIGAAPITGSQKGGSKQGRSKTKTGTKAAAKAPAKRRRTPSGGAGAGVQSPDSYQRRGVAEEARAAKATSDQPLTDKSQDKIGFSVYAEALSKFIASPDTSTPLVIGIDAPWGQGKSSLMLMIKNELNPRESRGARLRRWAGLQGWRLRRVAASAVYYGGRLVMSATERDRREILPAFDTPRAGEGGGNGAGPGAAAAAGASGLERLLRWCAEARRPGEPRHPTVWFNAWKFDHEEAIWSAMASAILDQLKAERSWPGRVLIWLRLQLKRANRMKMLKEFVGKVLWPVLLAGAALLWARYNQEIARQVGLSVSEAVRNAVSLALYGGALLASGVKLASIIEDPFSIPFKDYIDAPDYKNKIGFVGEFGEDFKRIVETARGDVWGWKPRKLVIFIDDLDRCEPPKSADVIEAINIFLDSEGCVFVIGMDSRAIVASIETKYAEMFKRVQSDAPDQPTLGRYFLEKIIQLPFAIPPIPEHYVSRLVKDIIGARPAAPASERPAAEPGGGYGPEGPAAPPPTPGGGGAAGGLSKTSGPQVDVGSYGNLEVWESINGGVKYLSSNPRQLKRFINSFRLQLYIADARGLFRELAGGRGTKGYTLDSLAAWTALCMRWPQIAACLNLNGQQDDFRRWLSSLAQSLGPDGSWAASSLKDAVKLLKPESLALMKGRIRRQNLTLRQALLLAAESPRLPGAKEGGKGQSNPLGYDWRTLPWERWLDHRDLLQAVKALEDWWEIPKEKQKDWLTMALMASE